jgi:flagellar hook protein FlgE
MIQGGYGMSIGSALQAGVSGLRTLSTKLATISDNIANSATVGYKRSDTQFASLVINGGGGSSYSAGGATASVRTQISRSGVIVGSTVNTDLAIAGGGFFTVATDAGGSEFAFTRAGSFRPDDTGALRNTAGYYLQGYALNPDGSYANGLPSDTTFDSLQNINIGSINGIGTATSSLRFAGNVPQNAAGPFQTGVQVFDAFGAPQQLTLNWVNAGPNVWNLEVYEGPVAGLPVGTLDSIDFGAGTAGAPDYAGAVPTGGAAGLVPAAGTFDLTLASGQTINIELGAAGTYGGVTQFAGDYLPETFADGAPLGRLQTLDVTEDGTMVAVFDTGERRPVFQIPLADVVNADGLTAIDGNAYRLSAESGAFRLQTAGGGGLGQVKSAALEGSNVDMAEELTSLIETQRAYSSNATVVRTADEMLEEVTRLKR